MTETDPNAELRQIRTDLALAVNGPYVPQIDDSVENLIWKAGNYRRQLESAHEYLNTLGIPRDSYTIRGRIEKMHNG